MHKQFITRLIGPLAVAALIAWTVAGCTDSTDPGVDVESLALEADSNRILVGNILQLRAVAPTDRGSMLPPRLIVWTTSDSAIARIDVDGNMYALSAGTVTVTAAAGGHNTQLQITVLPDPIVAVETGLVLQSCALLQSGRFYCWGSGSGQLGDEQTNLTAEPRRFSTGIGFTSLAIGGGHACGLDDSGAAYCWGWNPAGQVGDGSSGNDRLQPTAVQTTARFRQLSAGEMFTCGISLEGGLYCWGFYGDLATSPVPVEIGAGFSAVSAGLRHGCALRPDGRVYCWGAGALGNAAASCGADFMCSDTLVVADGGMRFKQVTARGYTGGAVGGVDDTYNCGVRMDNQAVCWEFPPVQDSVIAQPLFNEVGAGSFTCGLAGNGEAYCWGPNMYGQLGAGFESNYEAQPIRVAGGHIFRGISVGGRNACGWTDDDEIYCWGTEVGGYASTPRRIALFR